MSTSPAITITNLIWSFDRERQCVNLLLVRRVNAPFDDFWTLPETTMRATESADEAALRLVREKIGLKLSGFHTEQLATFTNPGRTPEQRTLSLAYMTFLPEMPPLTAGYGASDARWFTLTSDDQQYQLTNGKFRFSATPISAQTTYYQQLATRKAKPKTTLAFDHDWIFKIACDRIRNKLDYQPNVLLILGDTFTLKEARQIFAVFQQISVDDIDNSNFKKNHRNIFSSVGISSNKRPGRPAKVYRLNYLAND